MHLSSVLIVLFTLFLRNVYASPAPFDRTFTESLVRRQEADGAFQGPLTFQRVQTTQTALGSVTQTCDITLTPITGDNGEQLVRQDKSCRYSVVIGGQAPPPDQQPPAPPPPPPPNPNTSDPATTDPAASPTESVSDPGATPTASVSNPAATQPPATDSAVTDPAASGTVTDPLASGTGTATDPGATGAPEGGNGQPGDPNAPPGEAPSREAAEEAQPTGNNMPGQRLEVLPIGLGVFAGISVIALIVVGLVTYERTKYRKAFRQRKLAESGAGMGYGGMAERS